MSTAHSLGSGRASGNIEVLGNYFDSAWWVVLIILAIIFLFPLLILAIYFLIVFIKAPVSHIASSYPTSTPVAEPTPVTREDVEAHRDDSAIELSVTNSENVDGPTSRNLRT